MTILQRHPLIGRPLEGALRELVIFHGDGGYVPLYRFRPRLDRVEVLAVRHQREAGFR
ncbi:MAG: type II toxin-antitoxin system RelE/ParE family toxin [Candidatus Methylophosphatis roskildensis]